MVGSSEMVVINICESEDDAGTSVHSALDLTGDDAPRAEEDCDKPVEVDVVRDQRDMISALAIAQDDCITVENINQNAFSLPGTIQYARFAAALEKSAEKTIRLLFHGTPEYNIDSIISNGLDPNRRVRQLMGKGEYFGTTVSKCMTYCRGAKRVLVFAVLMDAETVKHDSNGVVVNDNAAYQLPLATIDFSQTPAQLDHTLEIYCIALAGKLLSGMKGDNMTRLVLFVASYHKDKCAEKIKPLFTHLPYTHLPDEQKLVKFDQILCMLVSRTLARIGFRSGNVVKHVSGNGVIKRCEIAKIHDDAFVPSFTIVLDGVETRAEFGSIYPLDADLKSAQKEVFAAAAAAPAPAALVPALASAEQATRSPSTMDAATSLAGLAGFASATIMAQATKVLGKRTLAQFHVMDSQIRRFVKVSVPPDANAGSKVTFVVERKQYTFEVPKHLTSPILYIELP